MKFGSFSKDLANMMVEKYGMGESIYPNKLDSANILEEAKEEVKKFLERYEDALARIKEKMLQNEIITKEELKEIVNGVF